jgi:hypothetical protein
MCGFKSAAYQPREGCERCSAARDEPFRWSWLQGNRNRGQRFLIGQRANR